MTKRKDPKAKAEPLAETDLDRAQGGGTGSSAPNGGTADPKGGGTKLSGPDLGSGR